MNSLVELIKQSQSRNLIREFDMSKSSNSILNKIKSYPFDNLSGIDSLPIEASKDTSWDVVHSREGIYLMKSYLFEMNKHMLYFINESLKESSRFFHFPELVVTENRVDIKLSTKDINDITETDHSLSKMFDEIYEEISVLY
tara:strand:- start:5638 stop:6063 length:426 start_codon:yes stop_codon:yes gene_type:complete